MVCGLGIRIFQKLRQVSTLRLPMPHGAPQDPVVYTLPPIISYTGANNFNYSMLKGSQSHCGVLPGSGNRHLWAIGQMNMILHSTDGGTTWNIEQTPLSPQHFFYTIAPVDSTLCFAIASDGKVYRAQYTILNTQDDPRPTQFSIVPQPVQDICLLSGAPTDEDQLRIYTFDGRVVQTIHLLPQHRTLDLSHLPSGAYFIHLGKVRRLLLKQ